MNKIQAKEALLKGEMVTHPNFGEDGYIKQIPGRTTYNFEDGYVEDIDCFWSYRRTESYDEGWQIITVDHRKRIEDLHRTRKSIPLYKR